MRFLFWEFETKTEKQIKELKILLDYFRKKSEILESESKKYKELIPDKNNCTGVCKNCQNVIITKYHSKYYDGVPGDWAKEYVCSLMVQCEDYKPKYN